jgi:predicted component of type VI protein secretion system
MSKPNAARRIQMAHRADEIAMLRHVRRAERYGYAWHPVIALLSRRWLNVLKRLKAAKRVLWMKGMRRSPKRIFASFRT